MIIGVMNVNGSFTLTVIELPAPAAPPVASEQDASAVPTESLHLAVTAIALSPRWAWAFVSWRALLVIVTRFVGAWDP